MKLLIIAIIITAYSNQRSQTDDTPNITASGAYVHHCAIAVSRDLEDQGVKIGCRVQLRGLDSRLRRLDGVSYCGGYYIVTDRMHWRKRGQADIFLFDNDQALEFGVQRGSLILLNCD